MRTLVQDLRFAVRGLRRRALFTTVAVATIALGIGAATAIYSIVDGVLLRPLPFHEPDRLVAVWQTFPRWKKEPILADRWDRITLSLPEFRDVRDHIPAFSAVAAWTNDRARLLDGERSEVLRTVQVSAGMLDVLAVRPALGRMFLPGEDVPGAEPTALVSYETWQTRYGGDPRILGRRVAFEDRTYTVIGVLPPGLTIGRTTQRAGEAAAFWTPVGIGSARDYDVRTNRSYFVIARLRPGATHAAAAQAVATWLDEHTQSVDKGSHLEPWQVDQTRDARTPLLLLLGAVAILLLIACANVATLLLGEATAREHEMAARLALGAGGTRLVRQLLTESLVLAVGGGALGTLLGWLGTRALVALAPPNLPGVLGVSLDARVLVVALLATGATGLLFGMAPAIALVRGAGVATTFRAGSGQSVRGRGALQRVMVAAELALSVVLLVGAGLLARSFARVTAVDPGFTPDHLLVAQTSLPRAIGRDSIAARRAFAEGLARIAALPDVREVTMASQPPFNGGSSSTSIEVEPRPGQSAEDALHGEAQQRIVVPGYFSTLGISLLAGRAFTDADRNDAPRAAIVSETLARRDFPDGSPVGRRVKYQGEWWTIVGVVGDVHTRQLTREVEATIYVPFTQHTQSSLSYLVRTRDAPSAAIARVRAAITRDPAFVVTSLDTMTGLMRRSYAEERYRTTIVSLFGAIAALLAGVGMYGVTARAVAQRTKESAIRLALGAGAWRVARQLASHTLAGASVGVVIGFVGAAATSRVLAPLLFGVSPHDPATYGGIVALLVAIALAASVGPARRAARVPLASVLKGDG